MRSVIVNGALILQDYCNRGFVSGGFFANDELNGFVGNFGQQQYFTRNSNDRPVVERRLEPGLSGRQRRAGDRTSDRASASTRTCRRPRVSQEPPFLTADAAGN